MYRIMFRNRHGCEQLLPGEYPTPEQANNAIRNYTRAWKRDVDFINCVRGHATAYFHNGTYLEWWRVYEGGQP